MTESIFEKIRNKRIKGYHNETDRLREDAGNESAIVEDYQGRAILELLQNADDAQFNPASDSHKVGDRFIEFELTKKSLIIRNGGYPISEEGLKSLASMHISPKDKKVMIGNKGIGFKSVLELTEQPIVHSSPFHFRFSEKDTRKLLDKENLLSILGEKSYCPILRLPFELPSDQRRCGDKQWVSEIQLPLKDQKAYDKSIEMLEKIGPKALIFLQGLECIKYKKNGDKKIHFSCDRDSKSSTPDELKDGEMIISDQDRRVSRYYRWVKTESIPGEVKEELPKNWQDLTHGQVAIAILLEEEGHGNGSDDNKICVYLPTEEFSPVKILIHGNFRLDSTRSRIHHKERYNQWLSKFPGLLLKEKVIEKFQKRWPKDEGKILDYLNPRIDIPQMDGIEKEIWNSIDKHLSDYPFIRVTNSKRKISPKEIYLPPDSIKHLPKDTFPPDSDIEGRYIPEDSFFSSGTRDSTLLALGAKKLTPEQIIESLDKVACPDPEWSAKAISLVVTLIQSQPKWKEGDYRYWNTLTELCCNTKIFLCRDGQLRRLEQSCPIFLSPEKKDEDFPSPPEFLNFAFLSRDVFEGLVEDNRKAFKELFVDCDNVEVHNFNRDSILKKVVLPWRQNNCSDSDRAQRLREFLFDLMKISKTDWSEPWNEKEDIRRVICQLPVSIKDGGETPAWQVYAGREWTGEESLERLYGNRKDRFFLEPPNQEWDEKTRKRWEVFYKWLGVSWRPKVLPYHLPGEEEHDSTWEKWNRTFSIQGPETLKESWKEYCQWLYKEVKWGLFSYTPHMKDNRFLDGWEQISQDLSLAKIALQLLTKEIVERNNVAIIKYSSNMSKDYQNTIWKPFSFFFYAIKSLPWLPASDKTLQPAFDLFMPDSQLDRDLSEILPRLNIGDSLSEETEDFLREIGVRSEFRGLTAEDWRRWASSIKERFPNPDEEERKKITTFYRRLLDEFQKELSFLLEDIDLLAFKGVKGADWGYQNPSQMWYLDKPEHKDLTITEEWFFAVTLSRKANRCKEIFGLRPFSEALTVEPFPGRIDKDLTEKLSQWFESRQHFLLARLYVERPKSRDKDSSSLKKMKIQCVESLKAKYQIQSREIDEKPEDAFLQTLENRQTILYLSSNAIKEPFHECRDLVSQMARNIDYRLDVSYKDAFKAILSCKEEDLIKELEESDVPADLIEDCKKRLEEEWKEGGKPKKKERREPGKEIQKGKEKIEGQKGAEGTFTSSDKDKEESGKDKEEDITPEYIGSKLGSFSGIGDGGSGGGATGGGGDTDDRRKETGVKGEEILFNELENNPQSLGFKDISEPFHKSKENPSSHYDIEILDSEKRKLYIEVKSSGSNRDILSFEMSDKQWKFAEEKQDSYQLWFIFDVWGKPKISGPHKPLKLEKEGKLERKSKEEIVYSCKVKL